MNIARLGLALFVSCSIALSACDGAAPGPDAGPPDAFVPPAPDGLWLVQTMQQDPSGRATYLQVTTSIEGDLDTSRAIERGGSARLFDPGGADTFFAGTNEAPTLTRYTVSADGALAPSGELSFASLGFSYLPYSNTFVDATRAVLLEEGSLTGAIWSPATFEVTGEIDLTPLSLDGFELSMDPGVARDGRVYVLLQHVSFASFGVHPGIRIGVIDPTRMEVVEVLEDSRCVGGYTRLQLADDGTIYAVGDGYAALANLAAPATPDTCVLRILPGEDTLDPTWQLSFPEVLGGRQAAGMIYVGGARALVPAVYEERVTSDPMTDTFGVLENPAAKWWLVDLEARTGRELDLDFHTLRGSVAYASRGRVFLGLPTRGFRGTTPVVELDVETGALTERMSVAGSLTHLRQLREQD